MENTIGKTIESILNQDYPNKEIVVINDGSVDKTDDVLKRYPIKSIKTEKIGISNARNLGYKNSSGDYIAFTDADCELDPLWTKKIMEGFRNEKVGIIGGKTIFKTDNSFSSIYRSLEFAKRYDNISSREVVWAGGPGLMIRRKILDEIGGFKPHWKHGEDAEISFLTVEYGYKILKIDDAITYHIPERGFWILIKKGYRDAKAYTRVTKSHFKISLRNKFNSTWYFSYDMYLIPILYAFLIISALILPVLFLINYFLYMSFIPDGLILFFLSIWFFIISFMIIFLLIYSLIPAFQVASRSKKKIKAFIGTIFLHHLRCLAWGIGLIIGIKNIIIRKK